MSSLISCSRKDDKSMNMKREPKLTFAVVMFNCVALLGCSNEGLVVCVCVCVSLDLSLDGLYVVFIILSPVPVTF